MVAWKKHTNRPHNHRLLILILDRRQDIEQVIGSFHEFSRQES